MLTRRGWSVVGAMIGLFLGGRIVGLGQLDALASMCLALVAGSIAWARLRRPRLLVEREVPERLTVGATGRVDLSVSSVDRATPTVEVTDFFDHGRRTARFRVPPLAATRSARAAYRIPTDRRGRHVLGPVRIAVTDAFGLARRSRIGMGTDEVLIYPRVHDILPPPDVAGSDLDRERLTRLPRAEAGAEFLTLRQYEMGDDLRRVHWRSTARRDELYIRQDEAPSRSPAFVLLDVRPSAHRATGFERAVEAAASLVRALERAGREVVLFDSTGARIGHPGRRHLLSVLDHLAVVEPRGPDQFAPTLITRRSGLVIAIVGSVGLDELRALRAMTVGAGHLVLVETAGQTAAALPGRPPLTVDGAGSFRDSWNEMVLRWHSRTTTRLPHLPSPA